MSRKEGQLHTYVQLTFFSIQSDIQIQTSDLLKS